MRSGSPSTPPRPDGTVYLLHFERPYRHAQHYLGWTVGRVRDRVKKHLQGRASPLVRAAVEAGIGVELVATWEGSPHLEASMKRAKNSREFCPVCKPALRAKQCESTRQRRAS